MDEINALSIISSLANGVDPMSGEVFAPHSPYQSPEVVRALFIAVRALESRTRAKPRAGLPSNAGKPWTQDEDQQLLAAFDRGAGVTELAKTHGRTVAGIQARLDRHGRLNADTALVRGAARARWRAAQREAS